jgi:hypothetical protein
MVICKAPSQSDQLCVVRRKWRPNGRGIEHTGRQATGGREQGGRFFDMPTTPTLREEGYPSMNFANWFGVEAFRPMAPAAFEEFFVGERTRWGEVIRAARIKAE